MHNDSDAFEDSDAQSIADAEYAPLGMFGLLGVCVAHAAGLLP